MTDPRPITFGARLRQLARERGAAEAVRFLAADGQEEAIGWDALDASVDRIAHVLAAQGVGRGDVVGIGLANTPTHLASSLAVWRLGATTLVADPHLTPELAAALKARIGARLWISETPGGGDLDRARLERLAAFAPATPVADAVSCPGKIVLSGGSTGLPKMMADDRPYTRIPGASWGRIAPALGFRADQVQLVAGALAHNAPQTWAQNGLFEGNRLILMEKFDADRALLAIDRFRVGFAMVVPTMMVRMLDRLEATGARLDSLHAFYHTGAPCPAWLKSAWIERLGPDRVFEMYGSGENTGQTVLTGPEWLARKGTVGRGFETEIRIYGPDGVRLGPRARGEIFMRPEDLSGRSRYLGPEAPRPRRDADGFQSIGDMGWLDDEGYLYLAGRSDDVINTGGVKVHPEVVEAELLRHPQVADAVVLGISDRDWGQRVLACIVPAEGFSPDPAALHDFCAAHLAPAEVPKRFELRRTLPRDGFGKIRRKALRAELDPDGDKDGPGSPPSGD
ncbi:AMP-binding protein [Rhodovulum sulfidophilum]|uniref:AMP-binding protein n=1 Tax=Rhodovulum sulfidophilum TaxID=35806 RepID=UPI0009515363|nr:AMP-binding protein [Rhodovulum sulfidophilum]OLS53160.1 acid-CoA ligase [Rhodovulum sulfidophilum]